MARIRDWIIFSNSIGRLFPRFYDTPFQNESDMRKFVEGNDKKRKHKQKRKRRKR